MKMAQFKALNASKGHYFFSKSAMRFFNSRIESSLYKNGCFITSEQNNDDDPRLFTVRRGNKATGTVETISEFGQFKTKKEAQEFIKNQSFEIVKEAA